MTISRVDSFAALFILLLEVLNPSSSFVRDGGAARTSLSQTSKAPAQLQIEQMVANDGFTSLLAQDDVSPSEEADGAILYVVLPEPTTIGVSSYLARDVFLKTFYLFDLHMVLIKPPVQLKHLKLT